MVTSKIPNWLTFPAAALGIALNFFTSGTQGALWAAGGWLAGAGISLFIKLLPVWLRFYKDVPIGYGDTKLIAAAGAFLGPVTVLILYYYFCLAYGILWLLQLLRVIPWAQIGVLFWLSKGSNPLKALDRERLRRAGKSSIPIGPAIAAGTLCAILLERQTLHFFGFS